MTGAGPTFPIVTIESDGGPACTQDTRLPRRSQRSSERAVTDQVLMVTVTVASRRLERSRMAASFWAFIDTLACPIALCSRATLPDKL